MHSYWLEVDVALVMLVTYVCTVFYAWGITVCLSLTVWYIPLIVLTGALRVLLCCMHPPPPIHLLC